MKEIIFGAGTIGKKYYEEYGDSAEILAFADNDEKKWGKLYCGRPVVDPAKIADYPYERVVVAISDLTEEGCTQTENILSQLKAFRIPEEKILLSDCRYSVHDERVDFLKRFSDIANMGNPEGAVAECGVYRGHFAGYINRYFPHRTLYLMDTFRGFDTRDVAKETNSDSIDWCVGGSIPWLLRGNAEIAFLRLEHRQKAVLRPGFIPDTLSEIADEKFIFVNLDMDLFAPTLAALRFFFPRITDGGILLLHDYYHPIFTGIREAADQFAKEAVFTRIPIGDRCSVAIVPSFPNGRKRRP